MALDTTIPVSALTYNGQAFQLAAEDIITYATQLNNTFNGAVLPESVTITAPHCTTLSNAFKSASGFEELTLTVPATPMNCSSLLSNAADIITLNLTNRLIPNACTNMLYLSRVEVINGEIDFSSIDAEIWQTGPMRATYLRSARFTPNTLSRKADFTYAKSLDKASVISLANALVAVGGQTIDVHANVLSICQQTYGSVTQVTEDGVTYDFFTESDGGTVLLADFITQTKGWTLI